MSLKAFHAWPLKEMSLLAHSVRTIVHYRGQVIFEQGSLVKGLYILWHGAAKMEHMQDVQGMVCQRRMSTCVFSDSVQVNYDQKFSGSKF